MNDSEFELGDVVRDTMTGFTGVAIAKTEWINGCIRLVVQPQKLDKDGKIQQTETVDIQQLELVKKKTSASKKVLQKEERSGGPMPEPRRPGR